MSKQQIQKMVEENFTVAENGLIIRVACYIRVSTEEQKLHGISLDAQRDKLKEYAEKHHLKIVGWYEDEGVSGRKLIKNRPALQQMLHDAQAGKFDRIIFIKLDRFFRSVAEYHECMKLIDPVLWTATEEKYDLTTANGRAFVNMKLTIAELEADQTGERIGIVNDYKIKTGQAITGAQSQGVAFTVKKDNEGVKRVVQDPDTKEICEDFISHFLTYQNKRQSTLYVNEKYGVNVHYNTFTKMLKDTKLYGFYKGNPTYCTGYVDKKTWDKIQSILKGNIKTQKSKRVYLYSGLIKCPHCGNNLSGNCSNTRTQKRPSGRSYTYNYDIKSYRCNKYAVSKQCDYIKRINEKHLEAKLLDEFNQYVTDYVAEASVEDNREDKNTDLINKRITSVKSEMTKVKRMYRKEDITEAEYDEDMAELKSELEALESQLEPLEERDLSIYEDLLKSDWRALYGALNDDNKRAFWRKYIKEIVVDSNGKMDRVIFF